MVALLLGFAVLIVILLGGNLFVGANPRKLSNASRTAGGVVLLAVAVFLGARGLAVLAIPVGSVGLGLLGLFPFGRGARTQKAKGQSSRVRSSFLEMELDHDTGAMRGRIVAGPHTGASLDAMPTATLAALMPDFDEESRTLLRAYLDRRDPHWGEGGSAAGRNSSTASTKMTEREASQILGIEPGASEEEIRRAHRTLMKKLHPDQGGTTYLAARINEAKDTLLNRPR